MRELNKKEKMENEFQKIPGWYAAEGWMVDKNDTPYRVGYEADNWWWYEKSGFRGNRVYCDKGFIERNFSLLTQLQGTKK